MLQWLCFTGLEGLPVVKDHIPSGIKVRFHVPGERRFQTVCLARIVPIGTSNAHVFVGRIRPGQNCPAIR